MNVHDWNWCLNDDETMAADANQATREGWVLVNEGGGEARIEKIDCLGILDGDADAIDIVCRSAAEGSEYHAAALEHIRTHNEEEWETIEEHIRSSGVDYLDRQQPAFEDVVAAVNAFAFSRMREIVDAGWSRPMAA